MKTIRIAPSQRPELIQVDNALKALQEQVGTLLVAGLNGEEFCDVPENFSFEMMRPMAYPGNV